MDACESENIGEVGVTTVVCVGAGKRARIGE